MRYLIAAILVFSAIVLAALHCPWVALVLFFAGLALIVFGKKGLDATR